LNVASGALVPLSAADRRRLATWLVHQSLVDRRSDLTIERIGAGNQNMVLRLGGGAQRMVLRRPAPVVPPGRNDAMAREFRVLSALEGTGVPHARPLALCTNHEIIGATFYVMTEVDGWSPAAAMDWPEPFRAGSDPRTRRQLALELVRGLATIAEVDWRAQGLSDFGRPDGFHDRQVGRWMSHWKQFRFRDIPGIEEAAAWLTEHSPTTWTPGLMHGDYSFLNVMFSNDPDPSLAAIVDWEMATIGDPILDLAWLARQWPETPDEVHTRFVDYTGMPLRDEIVQLYSDQTGNTLDDLLYYEVLANFKVAIVLEGGYARYLKGDVDNPKVAYYDEAILKAGRVARELIARRSPGIRHPGDVPSTTEASVTGARRIVTAEDSNGRSLIALDGPVPYTTRLDDFPGVEVEHLWTTNGTTVSGASGEEATSPGDGLFPPLGGTRFLRITYPSGFGMAAPDADTSQFERLLLHRSATIDYGVVVEGELTLVLDDGVETTLHPGDLLVQNGVMHGWRNAGDQRAVALFVLVGVQQ
jgi:aminoglycoside phosphotransferase (APT) family kinase protein